MTDPNRVTMHLEGASLPAQIEALEGNGGYLRVALLPGRNAPALDTGSEAVLEMHDGTRFRVTVVGPVQDAYRMKLLSRA